MAYPVYSAALFAGQLIGAIAVFGPPAGYKNVIRDIHATSAGAGGEAINFQTVNPAGTWTWFFTSQSAATPYNLQLTDLRVVLEDGWSCRISTAGKWTMHVSGYTLST